MFKSEPLKLKTPLLYPIPPKEILSFRRQEAEDTTKNSTFYTGRHNFSKSRFFAAVSPGMKGNPNLLRIEYKISRLTTKQNNSIKNAMNVVDRIENHGFKLDKRNYLSNNELNLLNELHESYNNTLRESSKIRSTLGLYIYFSILIFFNYISYSSKGREKRTF